jgi:hypothetical protein
LIPNATDVVEIQSNITGEVGQFTVDESSLAKIMSVLTNLYSDPEMAVIREYLTNALDAQIEASESDPKYVWRPIQVTTPSHFNKSYIVRDFGTGMNGDDLRDIYSKYGKSTKEQSNSVTGMLGLGSKCALTYTNQFTITGYKNGVKTVAIVSKDENDIPVFMIVDTSSTTEPNGVEISVPVRDRNTFAQKTREFLSYWKDGQVLVDGVEPAKHVHKLVKTMPLVRGKVKGDCQIHWIESAGTGYYVETPTSYVVMGNVPYAVDPEYVDEGLREANMGFVAYVPMGAVDFPPSREVLQYNTPTKEVVKKISEGLFELIYAEKIKEITDAVDHKTAWEKYHGLPHHFANHAKKVGITYRGLDFNIRPAHNHMELEWDWQDHGQISDRQYINMIDAMRGSLVVTGVVQGSKPSSYFKKKVKHYIETTPVPASKAILVDNDIVEPWLAWLPRIDADTIKAIKLPRAANGTGAPRADAPYDFYYTGTDGKVVSDSQVTINVPAAKTLVYISPQDMRETYRKQGTQPETLAAKLGPDVYLAVMGKNRFEKFLRTHPSAVPARTFAAKKVKELADAATDAEYLVSELGYGERAFMTKAPHAKIDDPELVDIIKIVQSNGTASHYQQAVDLVAYLRRADIDVANPAKKSVKNTITKRYPLIDDSSAGRRHMDHLVIYINAVYAQEYAPKP